MFIACRCVRCRRSLRVRECYVGKTLRCPNCAAVVIPTAPAASSRTDRSPTKAETKAAPAGSASSRRRVLPWLLLVPAALALALLMWAGHGWTLASSLMNPSPSTLPTTASSSALAVPNMRLPAREFVHWGSLARFGMRRHLDRGGDGWRRPSSFDLQTAAPTLGNLLAVALAPNEAAAFVTTADGLLKDFSYRNFELRATYRLEQPAYRAVRDGRRSLLWTAACAPANLLVNRHGDQPLGRGDLHIYALGALTRPRSPSTIAALYPCRVLPVAGDVLELLISPDQQAVFYLARTDDGVHLVRIDAERQVVDRHVRLADEIRTLCLTTDGKTLYAAGSGRVDVFDPATLQLRQHMDVNADVYAIAADNEGAVYLAEQGQWTSLTRLDLSGPQPILHRWSARLHGRIYLKMAPDQYRLYVGSSSVVSDHLDSLLIRDGASWNTPLVTGVVRSHPQAPVQGEFFLTPDGEFLINRWGSVFRLTRGSVPVATKNED